MYLGKGSPETYIKKDLYLVLKNEYYFFQMAHSMFSRLIIIIINQLSTSQHQPIRISHSQILQMYNIQKKKYLLNHQFNVNLCQVKHHIKIKMWYDLLMIQLSTKNHMKWMKAISCICKTLNNGKMSCSLYNTKWVNGYPVVYVWLTSFTKKLILYYKSRQRM